MTQPPNPLTPAEIAERLEALTAALEEVTAVYLSERRRSGPRSERSRAQDAKLRGLVNAIPRGPGSGQGGGPPGGQGGSQGAGGR